MPVACGSPRGSRVFKSVAARPVKACIAESVEKYVCGAATTRRRPNQA